ATWNGSSCSTPAAVDNTLAAALMIARNPANNVADLFNLATISPLTPALDAAPSSLVLALNFVPGDLSTPRGMAIDQSGDIWVASSTGGSNSNGSIVRLSTLGVKKSPAGGYTGDGKLDRPEDLAFDSFGFLWIANMAGNSVTRLNRDGDFAGGPFLGAGAIA